MDALKKNWPMFACTAAIIMTMVICTVMLMNDLRDIESTLDYWLVKIASNTGSAF